MLIYRDERYRGASYESLKVSLSSVRFYEKGTVPEDVQVVGRSRRSRMPVVLYGLLEIALSHGLEVTLQVSNREAAARFSRAFGVQETQKTAAAGSTYEDENAEDQGTVFDALTQ